MKKLLVYTLTTFLVACAGSDEQVKQENIPNQPLAKSKNSDEFNASFVQITNAYFTLKENFIEEND